MVHSQNCSAVTTSLLLLNTSSTSVTSWMKCGWFGANLAAQLACSRSRSRSKSFRPLLAEQPRHEYLGASRAFASDRAQCPP